MMLRPAVTALAVILFNAAAIAQTSEPINPDRPGVSNGVSTVGAGRLQIEAGGNGFWDEGDKAGQKTRTR